MSSITWIFICACCFFLGNITEATLRNIRNKKVGKGQDDWWNESENDGFFDPEVHIKTEKRNERRNVDRVMKDLKGLNKETLKVLHKVIKNR